MIFDVIILSLVAILSIIGYFKGFLNQFFTFGAIIAAYVLSPKWTYLIEGLMRDISPFSYVITDMFSRFIIGLAIFFTIKICGKFIEFMFSTKFKEFSSFNSWGGFFFGFLKSVMIVFIFMSFITLLPEKIVKKRFQALTKSVTYKISAKYNPIINPKAMENIRRVAQTTRDKTKLENINKSVVYNDYLKTKNLKNPLADKEILSKFRKGDTEFLKKNGLYDLLFDNDFMDFIHGEKYYDSNDEKPAPKTVDTKE